MCSIQRLKCWGAAVLTAFCWTMLGLTRLLAPELDRCQINVTTVFYIVYASTGILTLIYVFSYLACKKDLLDSVTSPGAQAIYMCMVTLSTPGSFLSLVLVVLFNSNCASSVPSKALLFAWISGGFSGACGLSVVLAVFISKLSAAMKESAERTLADKREANEKTLKELLKRGEHDFGLFLDVYGSLGRKSPQTAKTLDDVEKAYLFRYSHQLPWTVSTNTDSCPICMVGLADEIEVIQLPGCQHKFGQDCLVKWLEQAASCPVCKSDLRRALVASIKANLVQLTKRKSEPSVKLQNIRTEEEWHIASEGTPATGRVATEFDLGMFAEGIKLTIRPNREECQV